jgi:hypothetical protein
MLSFAIEKGLNIRVDLSDKVLYVKLRCGILRPLLLTACNPVHASVGGLPRRYLLLFFAWMSGRWTGNASP